MPQGGGGRWGSITEEETEKSKSIKDKSQGREKGIKTVLHISSCKVTQNVPRKENKNIFNYWSEVKVENSFCKSHYDVCQGLIVGRVSLYRVRTFGGWAGVSSRDRKNCF